MNKLIKSIGLAAALSGSVIVASAKTNNYFVPEYKTETEQAEKKQLSDEQAVLYTLAGLGVLGLAGCIGKKIKDFKSIPYDSAHNLIEQSYKLACNSEQYEKQELLLNLADNEYKLNKLLSKTKIYNPVAAAECQFMYGAIKHAVEHDDIPEKQLKEKTMYLFDKAVFPKFYFNRLEKQYLEQNPEIDFNRNYGQVKLVKVGSYFYHKEPLIYEGLKNSVLLKEINIMEQNVKNDKSFYPFYKYDRLELLIEINNAKTLLRQGKTLSGSEIYKINDLYRLKYLKKNIEI